MREACIGERGVVVVSVSKVTRRSGGNDVATRDRLREVATQLFFENGYEATTTRELSERAGIQKATLYYHIDSKEDLLFDICVESLTQMEAALSTALSEARNGERLEAAIRAHLEQDLNNVAAHFVMLQEMRSLGPDRRKTVVGRRHAYEALIQGLVEEAQVQGRLRSDIGARQLTLALMDLINWPIVWYRPGGSMTPTGIADFLIEIYLNGASAKP